MAAVFDLSACSCCALNPSPHSPTAKCRGPKKNKKGAGRDPEMDDWLSASESTRTPPPQTRNLKF